MVSGSHNRNLEKNPKNTNLTFPYWNWFTFHTQQCLLTFFSYTGLRFPIYFRQYRVRIWNVYISNIPFRNGGRFWKDLPNIFPKFIGIRNTKTHILFCFYQSRGFWLRPVRVVLWQRSVVSKITKPITEKHGLSTICCIMHWLIRISICGAREKYGQTLDDV